MKTKQSNIKKKLKMEMVEAKKSISKHDLGD
jgi:hypothetical protein